MSKKREDLLKKKERLVKEVDKAKLVIQKNKQNLAEKEKEIKQVEGELVACLLVENQLTVEELTDLLTDSEGKKRPHEPIH